VSEILADATTNLQEVLGGRVVARDVLRYSKDSWMCWPRATTCSPSGARLGPPASRWASRRQRWAGQGLRSQEVMEWIGQRVPVRQVRERADRRARRMSVDERARDDLDPIVNS